MTLMSAEVPPMSSVMRFSCPLTVPTWRPAITPAAGPESRRFTAWWGACPISATPPLDCMTRIGQATPASRQPSARRSR